MQKCSLVQIPILLHWNQDDSKVVDWPWFKSNILGVYYAEGAVQGNFEFLILLITPPLTAAEQPELDCEQVKDCLCSFGVYYETFTWSAQTKCPYKGKVDWGAFQFPLGLSYTFPYSLNHLIHSILHTLTHRTIHTHTHSLEHKHTVLKVSCQVQ